MQVFVIKPSQPKSVHHSKWNVTSPWDACRKRCWEGNGCHEEFLRWDETPGGFQHDLPCYHVSNRFQPCVNMLHKTSAPVCWYSSSPKKTQVTQVFLELWRYSGAELGSYLLRKPQLTSVACSPKDLSKLHCRSYAVHTDLYEPKCSLESPIHESGGIIIQGGVGVSPWCWWDWVLPQKMWKEQETGTSH